MAAHMQERAIAVISKPPEQRRDPEIEMLLPWLVKKSDMFEGIEKDIMMEIVRRCQYQKCYFDDVIIRQGEIGDSFYIMLTGKTSVYIDTAKSDDDPPNEPQEEPTSLNDEVDILLGKKKKEDVKPKKINREKAFGKFIINFTAGKSFGEIALISEDSVRNASIIADEETDLLVINRELFNSTLKAKKQQEFQERKDFVSNCVLFHHWSPKFKRLCEMSIRKEKFAYDTNIVTQKTPVDGLIFIIRGQAKVQIRPELHETQYPALFKKRNHLIESGLLKDEDKDEPAVIENVTQENIRVRRKEGYAAAEKRLNTKTTDVCFVEEHDIIGDVETAVGLTTYMQTVKCTCNTEVFILDAKQYERLIVKKNPQTIEIIRSVVESKVKTRLETVQGAQIILFKHVYAKIMAAKPTFRQQEDLTEEEKKRNIFMKRLVGLFMEDKAQLIEPRVPDSVHYKHKSSQRAKKKQATENVKKDTKPSVRDCDHESRLNRARMPRRRPRSRRELENLKIEVPNLMYQKHQRRDQRVLDPNLITPSNPRKHLAWGDRPGEGPKITTDGTEWTDEDEAEKQKVHKNVFITTSLQEEMNVAETESIDLAWNEIEDYQKRRSSRVVCSTSIPGQQTDESYQGQQKTPFRPKSAPLLSQIEFNNDDDDSEEYFDFETSDRVLTSLEERLKQFYGKAQSDESRRNFSRVAQLKRFEIQEAKSIPVPGGTVFVKAKPCRYPRGTYVDPNHHQHVRRFILQKSRPKSSVGFGSNRLLPASTEVFNRPQTATEGRRQSMDGADNGSGLNSMNSSMRSMRLRPQTASARIY